VQFPFFVVFSSLLATNDGCYSPDFSHFLTMIIIYHHHRCNKRFYVFNVFYILFRFFIFKTLSKTKYEYAKIQRETFLEDAQQ